MMTYRQIHAVDEAYYTSNVALGGNGGYPFYCGLQREQCPQSGTVVRSLKAWCDTKNLRCLEVGLTDGFSKKFGRPEGTPTDTFYFATGEKVTSLKLWGGDHQKGRSGGFQLTTNQSRTFSVDPSNRTGVPYQPELGCGILVGVFGSSGIDIDCLGFGLLRRIESAHLINVKYPNLSTLLVTTAPKEIRTIIYDNSKGTTAQTVTLAGSETVETSQSWSVTAGMEAGVETEVKAGFPILAEAKVTVSAKVSVSGTYSRTNKQTTQQSFSLPITVAPGECVQATATLYEGNIDTKYTATMVYKLESGKLFNYDINGTYSGVSVSEMVVTVTQYC